MKTEDIILKEEDMRDKIDLEHIIAYEQFLEVAEYISYAKLLYDKYSDEAIYNENSATYGRDL